MRKIKRPEQPNWFSKKTNKKQLLEGLLKITNYHCFYTDKKIDIEIAEIKHFKPPSIYPELDFNWNNLFIAEPYTNRIKANRYDEKLLNPCDENYDFDKYFIIDFESARILPSTLSSKKNMERANVTIQILGLNNTSLIQDRKEVTKQYIFLYKLLKEKAEIEGKKFNKNDYKELNINDYSYRFYIERALAVINKEVNEFISEIEIKNYFGIKNFLISELSDKKEIYFLGENGDGKTLVLQSIILALRGLDDKFLYKFISENITETFKIQIQDVYTNSYAYNTSIANINKNSFAYGASRLKYNKQSNNDNNGYLSLFDFNSSLIDPVQWLKEIERKELKGIGNLKLENAINLLTNLLEGKVEILRTKDGEFIFHERGTKVIFNHLSDGYRSTIIWLSDLISRLSTNQPEITDLKQYKGIVLVDEIGVFLHPRWEFSIVKNLRKTFPNIQWIFTTHSPVVILGASNDAAIYKLYKEKGITKVTKPFNEPLAMTANSLLTSLLWKLDTFTTEGLNHELVSSDDYVYQKIHQTISKYVQEVPSLNDETVLKMIEEEFEKIRTK